MSRLAAISPERPVNHGETVTQRSPTYGLVWTDPFWGRRDHGLTAAPDLETAVEQAPPRSATGLVLDEVHGPDGWITGLAGPGPERAVTVLADRDDYLFEATVSACTISEAFAVAHDVAGPSATIRALAVNEIVLRPEGDEDFGTRTELPQA
jgi:hypothetical protein